MNPDSPAPLHRGPDEPRDLWLRRALGHAPDADSPVPASVEAAVLRAAQASLASNAAKPAAAPAAEADGGHSPGTQAASGAAAPSRHTPPPSAQAGLFDRLSRWLPRPAWPAGLGYSGAAVAVLVAGIWGLDGFERQAREFDAAPTAARSTPASTAGQPIPEPSATRPAPAPETADSATQPGSSPDPASAGDQQRLAQATRTASRHTSGAVAVQAQSRPGLAQQGDPAARPNSPAVRAGPGTTAEPAASPATAPTVPATAMPLAPASPATPAPSPAAATAANKATASAALLPAEVPPAPQPAAAQQRAGAERSVADTAHPAAAPRAGLRAPARPATPASTLEPFAHEATPAASRLPVADRAPLAEEQALTAANAARPSPALRSSPSLRPPGDLIGLLRAAAERPGLRWQTAQRSGPVEAAQQQWLRQLARGADRWTAASAEVANGPESVRIRWHTAEGEEWLLSVDGPSGTAWVRSLRQGSQATLSPELAADLVRTAASW